MKTGSRAKYFYSLDFFIFCDIIESYITSVECGKRNISIVNIEKLAKALNVTLAEFFKF